MTLDVIFQCLISHSIHAILPSPEIPTISLSHTHIARFIRPSNMMVLYGRRRNHEASQWHGLLSTVTALSSLGSLLRLRVRELLRSASGTHRHYEN
jgi:hypothetical protein